DAVSTATPLAWLKMEGVKVGYQELFWGKVGGSLGETSAPALLLGAAWLLYRGYIDWRIPAGYLGTVAVLALALGQDPLFHLLAGGLLLGAFFMATDPVTSPVTSAGRWVFGAGCGLITMVIRLFGGYPEGVAYSILIMNGFTPLLDRFLHPVRYGEVRRA
ncbi:MAG: RnfABCDGE type electron transport complex subunit D, partial [Bacillota bacterium]|nr:RnfABCDGE type electron transport complex subunit D [Bacillota bacterium]